MSQRDRTYRTHALILRRRDYNDADRILTLFTPNNGKFEAIAKGVRKTTSHKAGHLELFAHVSLLLAQASTWDIVTEVVTVESFRHMRTDLDTIGRVSYVGELVDAFAESDDAATLLWDLALFALRTLNDGVEKQLPFDRNLFLRWFELHLLSLAGFEPQLFTCLGCDEALQPVMNYLSIADGGVYCGRCAKNRGDTESLEPDVLKVLRFLQSKSWLEAAPLHARPPILRRTENILYRYLFTLLERRLRSTDFLRRLQALVD